VGVIVAMTKGEICNIERSNIMKGRGYNERKEREL